MVTIGGEYGNRAYIYKGRSGFWSFLGYLRQDHYMNSVIEHNGVIFSTGYSYYRREREETKDHSDDPRWYYTTAYPYLTSAQYDDGNGIERIEIYNSSISTEIISSHSAYGHARPILFPTGQYDCSTPIY